MNEEFKKKIIALRGDKGKKWLEDLPQTIEEYEKKWNIKCFSPFNNLSYNYVAPAQTSEGEQAVLKISFPDNTEFIAEIEALRFYDGDGAIRVLKENREQEAVLLEKAIPGTPVKQLSSFSKQVHVVSGAIKQFHKPVPSDFKYNFPSILDWADAFNRYLKLHSPDTGPIPRDLFEKAQNIFTQYPKDKNEQVLLHGDLHNDNVLSSERGWLVIDPKGVIGEREFELGAFLRNPYTDYPEGSDYKKITTQNTLQFSEELGFEKKRILDWAFACSVISLIWFLEDEGKFSNLYLENAELLNGIIF